VAARLHAKTSVVNEQDKICSFAISAFPQLKLGFIRGRSRNEAVETKLDCHPTSLVWDDLVYKGDSNV